MAEPKEETDYLLGPLFTRVSFRVHAPDTRFGETLAVCGELPEFGGWDPTQALRLQTSAETFPTWHSDTVLIGTYVASVQYKFVLISADGASVRWEETPSNRQFAPVGEELSLVEEWGRVSACPGSVHGTPEVSSLDTPMRGPAGLEGTHSLDLPPSLSEVARTARAPVLAEPLDGSERVLNVLSRLPIALSKDAASGEWRAEWEESSMWATSVDGGRSVLGSSAGVQIAYIGSPGRYIGREDQPAVAALLEKYGCYPVFIDPWDLHDAYMEYSKTTLWPLLHNELPTQNAGRGGHYRRAKEAWSAYQVRGERAATRRARPRGGSERAAERARCHAPRGRAVGASAPPSEHAAAHRAAARPGRTRRGGVGRKVGTARRHARRLCQARRLPAAPSLPTAGAAAAGARSSDAPRARVVPAAPALPPSARPALRLAAPARRPRARTDREHALCQRDQISAHRARPCLGTRPPPAAGAGEALSGVPAEQRADRAVRAHALPERVHLLRTAAAEGRARGDAPRLHHRLPPIRVRAAPRHSSWPCF